MNNNNITTIHKNINDKNENNNINSYNSSIVNNKS